MAVVPVRGVSALAKSVGDEAIRAGNDFGGVAPVEGRGPAGQTPADFDGLSGLHCLENGSGGSGGGEDDLVAADGACPEIVADRDDLPDEAGVGAFVEGLVEIGFAENDLGDVEAGGEGGSISGT